MLAPRTIYAHSEKFLLKKQTKHFMSSPAHSGMIGMLPRLGDGSGVENLPSVHKDTGYIRNTQNQKIIKTQWRAKGTESSRVRALIVSGWEPLAFVSSCCSFQYIVQRHKESYRKRDALLNKNQKSLDVCHLHLWPYLGLKGQRQGLCDLLWVLFM